MSLLDRAMITAALTALNERLAARSRRAELFLVGGAIMCLATIPHPQCVRARDLFGARLRGHWVRPFG